MDSYMHSRQVLPLASEAKHYTQIKNEKLVYIAVGLAYKQELYSM